MGDPNKHYERSDGTRHVIIGEGEGHGHIVYDKNGDVDYIRDKDTDRERPEYDTRKGDNVDDPNWPWSIEDRESHKPSK